MKGLVAKLPDFTERYDVLRMRELVRHLEALFARVEVVNARGAYVITANTTLGSLDEIVLVDTAGGAVTVTLPEISDEMVRNRQEFEVVLVDATNSCTVAPTGADTIVGESSVLIEIQWTALRFRATTGNWVII